MSNVERAITDWQWCETFSKTVDWSWKNRAGVEQKQDSIEITVSRRTYQTTVIKSNRGEFTRIPSGVCLFVFYFTAKISPQRHHRCLTSSFMRTIRTVGWRANSHLDTSWSNFLISNLKISTQLVKFFKSEGKNCGKNVQFLSVLNQNCLIFRSNFNSLLCERFWLYYSTD